MSIHKKKLKTHLNLSFCANDKMEIENKFPGTHWRLIGYTKGMFCFVSNRTELNALILYAHLNLPSFFLNDYNIHLIDCLNIYKKVLSVFSL